MIQRLERQKAPKVLNGIVLLLMVTLSGYIPKFCAYYQKLEASFVLSQGIYLFGLSVCCIYWLMSDHHYMRSMKCLLFLVAASLKCLTPKVYPICHKL